MYVQEASPFVIVTTTSATLLCDNNGIRIIVICGWNPITSILPYNRTTNYIHVVDESPYDSICFLVVEAEGENIGQNFVYAAA